MKCLAQLAFSKEMRQIHFLIQKYKTLKQKCLKKKCFVSLSVSYHSKLQKKKYFKFRLSKKI